MLPRNTDPELIGVRVTEVIRTFPTIIYGNLVPLWIHPTDELPRKEKYDIEGQHHSPELVLSKSRSTA